MIITEAVAIAKTASVKSRAPDFDITEKFAKLSNPINAFLEKIYDSLFKAFQSEKDIERVKRMYYSQQQRIIQFLDKQGIDKRKIDQIIKNIEQGKYQDLDKIFTFDFIINEFKEELKNIQAKDALILAVMFIFIYILNTVVMTTCVSLFGPMGLYIGAILCAPFTEEIFKRAAVKQYKGFLMTSALAGAEALSYIMQFAALGFPVLFLVIVRLFSFVFHLSTTYFHKKTQLQSQFIELYSKNPNNYKIKQAIEDRGTLIAQVLHAFWNGVVTKTGLIGVGLYAYLTNKLNKG